EQVDQLVRKRLEQAFGSVFSKVLTATERAAQAAEAQAQANRLDGLTKGLKLDIWKPSNREEELRGWKDWFFQLRTWLASHDSKFEEDIGGIEVDVEQDHAFLDAEATMRSQKLFGVLCSYVRGRPLLLVKSQESTKNGLEAIRLLKREMEPRERARALAIVRNLASWTFKEGGLHEQLVAFEEAVTAYERASGKVYSQDLMIATVVTGLREPLRSQVQLRMNDKTEYKDLREWVLSYESVNAPWSVSVPTSNTKASHGYGQEATPMEVDQIKGKGKKGKYGKGKDKGPGKGVKQIEEQTAHSQVSSGQSVASTSASAYRTPSTVQVVRAIHAEVDSDFGNFSLEVLQIWTDPCTSEIVVDSGADISVAPLSYQHAGEQAAASRVLMQDAQGNRIMERGDDQGEVCDCGRELGDPLLGEALRSGWNLGHNPSGPTIAKDGCEIAVGLRRNTLVIAASISMVAALDSGALPPEGEEAVESPGWHILPSGLPFFVGHSCLEISLETSVWSAEDWAWIAVFVRKEPATRKPQAGDVWVQVWTGPAETFPETGRAIAEIEEELGGRRDFAVLFHVEEMPENVLSCPGALFAEPAEDEPMAVPAEEVDDGGGIGDDDVWAGRPVQGQEQDKGEDDGKLDGIALDMETPLAELRDLCKRLGLASSGPKPKVLKRLRVHKEVLEKQLATEIAQGIYKEQERNPDTMKVPVLPTPQQQEAHFITHQPFASWCSACVLARSRQTPHSQGKEAQAEKDGDKKLTTIQIDYAYTFTGDRGIAEEEKSKEASEEQPSQSGDPEQKEEDDKANQFALNLVAGEAVTGWLAGLPVVAKGAASLKRVTETLVRTSILIAGSEDVVVQGDTEPAIGQILNAIQACRARLGLRTVVRQVPRDSHQSNGVAEKAVSTLRRLALTLKAHLEERIKASTSGSLPVFAWLMKHAAFLHNRFFVGTKGTPPYEAVHGRRFRGKLIPFGEKCIGYVKSKFKGDLQWRKAVFVGVNERTGAYALLGEEGGFETRVSHGTLEAKSSARERFTLQGRQLTYLLFLLFTFQPRAAAASKGSTRAREADQQQNQRGKPKQQADQQQNQRGPEPMEVSKSSRPGGGTGEAEGISKRARLLLDKPAQGSPTSGSSLYPPGFAGIRAVHNDVLAEELVDDEAWSEELFEAMAREGTEDDSCEDRPPEVTPDELAAIDFESDKVEVERLVSMGVLRKPHKGEDLSGHSKLTTKMVRDWRRRPHWIRRSRLVGREYKTWEPWRAELFAPSSSLGVVHSVMAWALTMGLEICTIDVKDAYLNCQQKQPVIVEVDSRLIGEDAGMMTFVLERSPEPMGLVLHADDGILAASRLGREKVMAKLGEKVVVQVSEPLKELGDSLEFLKRKYILEESGIVMFSGEKHLEGLVGALGNHIKARDAPTDQSVIEPDTSSELPEAQAKVYRECVGRLLYLSQTRPDIQFGTCALTSKMAKPTSTGMKHLGKVVGYLLKYPTIGFLIKPIKEKACVDYVGDGPLFEKGTVVLESVSDADWAGCKTSRKSRSSVQFFLGGSLVGSFVRSQRTVALSSGESEFNAMISGACDLLYLKECFSYVTKDLFVVKAVSRSDSAAARGIGSRVGCGRVRHLHCSFLWLQESVRKGDVDLRPIGGQRNPADIGTKPLPGKKLRELLYRCGAIGPDGERFGAEEHQEAEQRATVKRLLTSTATSGASLKKALPVLMILAQVLGAEGFEGLGVAMAVNLLEDTVVTLASSAASVLILMGFFIGAAWAVHACGKSLCRKQKKHETKEASSQASLGPSKSEEKFMQEYVTRATELRTALHEEHQTVESCEKELVKALELFSQLPEHLQPNRYTYTALFDAVVKGGGPQTVLWALWNHLQRSKVTADLQLMSTMLQGCSDVSVVEELLGELDWQGLTPNLEVLSSMLGCLRRAGAATKKTWEVLQVAKSCELSLDCQFLVQVVTALGFANDTGAVVLLMESVREVYKVEPDVFLYTAAISQCARAGDVAGAETVIRLMQQDQVEPNEHTHCAIIAVYSKAGKLLEAVRHFQEANEKVALPIEGYTSLLSGCRAALDNRCALQILKKARLQGPVKSACYTLARQSCALAGDEAGAAKVDKWQKRDGVITHVPTSTVDDPSTGERLPFQPGNDDVAVAACVQRMMGRLKSAGFFGSP
ncbi:unnamed protein product, partial [Symbiodinium necroappetens]